MLQGTIVDNFTDNEIDRKNPRDKTGHRNFNAHRKQKFEHNFPTWQHWFMQAVVLLVFYYNLGIL